MAKQRTKKNDGYGTRNNPVANSPFEVVLYPTDRSPKNVGKWKQAIQAAENIEFPQRTALLDLYEDIKLDPILSSCLDKRRMAITDSKIEFGEDGKSYPEIEELIDMPWFEEMLSDIIDARFEGHSLMWFDPSNRSDIKYKLIPRKNVIPEAHEYKRYQHDLNGLKYNKPPYTNYSYEVGNNHKLGLLAKAVPFVLLKRGNFSDWATFAEIFGQPLRKGKYPTRDNEAKLTLKKAMEEAGSSPYIVIPDELDVTFEQATANSDGRLFEKLGDACDNQVIFLILGQLLTTKSGDKGARALGEVHLEEEKRINRADKRFVLNALNYSFRKLLAIHGYNIGNGKFSFGEENTMPINEQLAMDEKLDKIVEIPPEYFYEKYNIPLPKGGASRVVKQSAAPFDKTKKDANLSESDFFE